MKFLKKLKSSNFWVSMISAVVLILQAVFNVDIKTEYLNQIILGILGVLVMSGIVTDTATDEVTVKQTFDFDSVKESISSMFTQISTTLQTDISNIMSKLEKTNDKTQEVIVEAKKDESEQTNVANATAEEVVNIVDEVKPKEVVVQQTFLQQTNAPKNEL